MFFPVGPSRSAFGGREPDPSPLTEQKRVHIVRSLAILSGVVHVKTSGETRMTEADQKRGASVCVPVPVLARPIPY
jgi:hypothetical protein